MAAPLTAGVAALLRERRPGLAPVDVVRRIESNLHIDLEKESLCGFKLIRSIPGVTGARRSRKA